MSTRKESRLAHISKNIYLFCLQNDQNCVCSVSLLSVDITLILKLILILPVLVSKANYIHSVYNAFERRVVIGLQDSQTEQAK